MRPTVLFGCFLALLSLVACSNDRAALTVDVVTNLVPGAEFSRVETEVFRYRQGGRGRAVQGDALTGAVAEASWGLPYAFGQRVASFEQVDKDDLLVRVRLHATSDDSVLIERAVRIKLERDYSLRIYVERDCVDVVCPGSGSAALSECQAGKCVDPRCNPQDESTRSFCPQVRFCNSENDCSPVSACAVRNCVDGICIPSAQLPPVCNMDEWCDDARGCLPGGQEASDSLCGRLCFDANTPCSVGYWKCDGGTRTCAELWRRPAGSECGASLVCVDSGECVGCEEGAECRIGCRMGEVSCASGVPVCEALAPVQEAPIGASCNDDASVCYNVATCAGSGECLADGSCGPPSDPAIELAPCGSDGALVLLTDESGGSDSLCIRLRGLLRGDEDHPEGQVELRLTTLDEEASPDTSEVSLSVSTLTFTRGNAGTFQSVAVTGLDDSVNDGDVSFLVRVAVLSASDERYAALPSQEARGVNATVCAAGFAECNGAIEDGCERDILRSIEACGACDVACDYANATARCVMGRCEMGACDAGFTDCNGDPRDGCELEVGASCSINEGCRRGTWACGVDDTGNPIGVCDIDTIFEPGTPCGEGSGFFCDSVGECDSCVVGAACTVPGAPCKVGITSCLEGEEVCTMTGAELPVNSSCGDHSRCSPTGSCESVLRTASVDCGDSSATADELCRALDPRFSGAIASHGYSWGQCAGPMLCGIGTRADGSPGPRFPDAPALCDLCNGWSEDGLDCVGTFIGSTDCVGMPFYYDPDTMTGPRWGFRITEIEGYGSTRFDAPSLIPRWGCNGWNPGWTVRLHCLFAAP